MLTYYVSYKIIGTLCSKEDYVIAMHFKVSQPGKLYSVGTASGN